MTGPVKVYTRFILELEGVIFDNVAEKECRFMTDVAAREAMYLVALLGDGRA